MSIDGRFVEKRRSRRIVIDIPQNLRGFLLEQVEEAKATSPVGQNEGKVASEGGQA